MGVSTTVKASEWDPTADEMLKILDLLDERTEMIGSRLEQIVVKMGELRRKDEERRRALAEVTPARIRDEPGLAIGTGYRCKMGRMILMMGILSTLASAERMEAREKKPAYEGIQGLLESVAMGILEKQMDMKEMDKNLSAKKVELTKLEKTIRRRQMLQYLTSREIEEGMLKLKEEKEKMEEEKVQWEEPANCTMMIAALEKLAAGEAGISGLHISGVFTHCGLLAALGWGGVISSLIMAARA
jgi:hypothetical protein